MQTYRITNSQSDLAMLTKNQNEPIIIKNNVGTNFLLMPFSADNMQYVFLNLYKSFKELNKKESQTLINAKEKKGTKMTAEEFTTKWLGFMKDTEISENYKDEYYEFLNKKYQ